MHKWFFYVGFIVWLLFTAHQAFAQPINWDSVRSDYVKKYQPQEMPAWLFPIIFEEGGGQRDTIYLGYDLESRDLGWPLNDTIFGERYWPADTGRFNVVWGEVVNDSAFESIVRKSLEYTLSISLYQGNFPLTMYWDRTTFYSDSLPFLDTISPKGMGYFYCIDGDPNYHNCNLFYPYYMTDDPLGYYSFWDSCAFAPPSSVPYIGPHPCYATDSIVLYGTLPLGGGMSIEIVPYGSHITGIPPSGDLSNQLIKLYPNPGRGDVTIDWNGDHPATFQFYNTQGIPVFEGTLSPGNQQINLTPFPPGMYFINVVNTEGHKQTATYLLTR